MPGIALRSIGASQNALELSRDRLSEARSREPSTLAMSRALRGIIQEDRFSKAIEDLLRGSG